LEEDGNYAGELEIIIYDHFGLDINDILPGKDANRCKGFYYWFVLQHWDGFNQKYKPFVTVIKKKHSFKGNWKKDTPK
jgi:hypothetical protein